MAGNVTDGLGRQDMFRRTFSHEDRLSFGRSRDDFAPRIDDAALSRIVVDQVLVRIRDTSGLSG